jgi:uncharacterized membrane protein
MDFFSFIQQYFLNPIDERAGYNIVNTAVYVAIALAALWLIRNFLKSKKVQIDNYFVYTVIAFVLFGSTKRVITDALDSGMQFNPLVNSLLSYNAFNVTPGIYLFVGGLFLVSVAIDYLTKRKVALWIGIALFVVHLLVLISLLYRIDMFSLGIILVLAAIPFAAFYPQFKDKLMPFVIFAQGLDGGATFTAMDLKSGYFEQHVFSNLIGQNFGFFAFYLFKIALATAFVYLVDKEKMDSFDKRYLLVIAMIFGLAPGLRDLLRVAFGV